MKKAYRLYEQAFQAPLKWLLNNGTLWAFMAYIMALAPFADLKAFASHHIFYTTGKPVQLPVFAFELALLSLASLLCSRNAVWSTTSSFALAIAALVFSTIEPHCEFDPLILVCWLCVSWAGAKTKPTIGNVAWALLAIILAGEVTPSPVGTPYMTFR